MASLGSSKWEKSVQKGTVESNYENLAKASKKSWVDKFGGQLGIAVGASTLLSAGIQSNGFKNLDQIDKTQLGADIVNAGITESIEYGLKTKQAKKIAGTLASKVKSTTLFKTLQKTGTAVSKLGTKVATSAVGKTVSSTATRVATTTVGKGVAMAGKGAAFLAKGLLNLLGGPIGLALLLIEVTFSLIDALWNPFQTYYNKDLAEYKQLIESGIRKEFQQLGRAYPFEVKPNIQPETDEEVKEYWGYYDEYLTDRGLVSAEEVKSILDAQRNIAKINRMKRFTTARYVQLSTMQVFDEQEYWANYIVVSMTETDNMTQRSILMLLTAALYKKGLISRARRTVFRDISDYLDVYWPRILVMSIVLFFVGLSLLFVIKR